MFAILDYSSALEYSIIRRYTNIVYYYYYIIIIIIIIIIFIFIFIIIIILLFDSTYLCEAGFSTIVSIKTKNRNRLDVGDDMRLTLANARPRISKLTTVVVDLHRYAC